MAASVLPRVRPRRPDDNGDPRPGRRPVLAEWATPAGWIVTTPLAVLVVAWLFGLDRWSLPFSLAITFLPLVLAPAWVVAAGAAASRRWPLAATAGLVAVAHLVALFPAISTASPRAAAGVRVRVVTANALYDNATPDAWAEAALALDADVLVVQEYSLTIADALDRAGVTERYPEMEGKALPWSAGVALFSRYPLRRPSMSAVGDGIVAATVELGDLDVRVVNVHTSALQYQDEWRESFADLERFVAEQPFPLVVAGDFNATVWHRPMRDLLAGPLRDAHLDRGRGLAASWPEQRPGPPFALIDHVLVTPMIGVEDIGERRLPGSDHRAVVANLRLAAR